MHMTIDAGKVAHNAMAWREGSVLGQATWPPFSDQGQVLALKGLHPKKKNYLLGKRDSTRTMIVGSPLEAGDEWVL